MFHLFLTPKKNVVYLKLTCQYSYFTCVLRKIATLVDDRHLQSTDFLGLLNSMNCVNGKNNMRSIEGNCQPNII